MRAINRFKGIDFDTMREFLEEKHDLYNNPQFIINDPISIPHRYEKLQDREIAGFLAATIAWGRRDLILRGASQLMDRMGDSPYEFITLSDDTAFNSFSGFVYRTFNGFDAVLYLKALKRLYVNYSSMEDVIVEGMSAEGDLTAGLSFFREIFFRGNEASRSRKHFADIRSGAAGKRLFMFLRWMVRRDKRGVDFGLWQKISPSLLSIPLDFHTGNTARKLGLLKRKSNDWKAVSELTAILRQFDPDDPAKYDFALFGMGVNEGLK